MSGLYQHALKIKHGIPNLIYMVLQEIKIDFEIILHEFRKQGVFVLTLVVSIKTNKFIWRSCFEGKVDFSLCLVLQGSYTTLGQPLRLYTPPSYFDMFSLPSSPFLQVSYVFYLVMCMWTHVFSHVGTWIHVHMEARGQHWVSFSIACHCMFLNQSLLLIDSSCQAEQQASEILSASST